MDMGFYGYPITKLVMADGTNKYGSFTPKTSGMPKPPFTNETFTIPINP
jgi:hypothetical protein